MRFCGVDAQKADQSADALCRVIFAQAGAYVAILTAQMRTAWLVLALALPAQAQRWSASVGTGPFVFGHFAERTVAIGNEGSVTVSRTRLSATTRAGASADIERDFGRWLGVRLEAAWTRAPLSIKGTTGSGVSLDAGRINVTTLMLPLILHLNRGSFRFQIVGGPAYGLYSVDRRTASGATKSLFEGTRGRWGGAVGIGASWWWRPRFGVEWQATDIVTDSPFHAAEIALNGRGVRILRPQNGHSTIGIRYRF